jgi:hypothetical protein
MIDPAPHNATRSQRALLDRAQAQHTVVVVVCECSARIFSCGLRSAQAQNETTNALIRQAIRKHSEECDKAREVGAVQIRLELAGGRA